ncbi:hypothetical protein BGZ97_002082 [Linnemannia gamsii]|uniref:Uncharacterized protein n=1 Tax=Linnemannia gamsii TaxID=64522 RepID=A0A9P6UIH8_9FUNG|nr:hypothetical protein BGZ97_002082 [Linnemannia gamsii]
MHSALLVWLAISRPANRHGSAICFIGGLTFCGDSKQLQIPNLIAAERFGNATLDRLKLRLEDVDLASWNIVSSGNVLFWEMDDGHFQKDPQLAA